MFLRFGKVKFARAVRERKNKNSGTNKILTLQKCGVGEMVVATHLGGKRTFALYAWCEPKSDEHTLVNKKLH